MGFDIECIIDIQTYPGEYFCPVCRTLVYPSEALQSLCSHLYCKPCLAHIANGSKACPYDGYLVTESDSKPLIDSDKSLVEKIGKVKVHCLFFRSGCTWEGTLSDCTTHCSGCSFGNSPVICNRCGIQIIHRQVHDHAQSCPGVYEAQPTTGVVPGATTSTTVSATTIADLNHTVSQSGPPLSQSQNLQNVVTQQPGQNPNLQSVAHHPAPAVAASLPTTEQWYQQQYQQYYQQYPGYDPYQQPQQQYYSLQQQPLQQYQQHPLPVHGQAPSHAYAQPSTQLPVHSQPLHVAHPGLQLHPQTQTQFQSQSVIQTQPQTNFQLLAQGQAQPLPQLVPAAQSHVQVPPQGQPQLRPPVHSLTSNYQVNPQQPAPIPVRPQSQVPTQFPPAPLLGQPTQQPPYAQVAGAQPAIQHPPVHQPPLQMHPSQTHGQPQTQVQNQVPNQSHLPTQQPLQYHNQPLQVRPPLANLPAVLQQPPHTTTSVISGHLSYPQPQPVQPGTLQQYPVHQNPAGGPMLPVKVQGPIPQQPVMMRPPPPQASMPLQQSSAFVPPHNQVPSLPHAHQQTYAHAQPPMHHLHHGALMHNAQSIPIQSAQQQTYLTPTKGHANQQTPFPHHQPLQTQFRPYGSSQSMQSQNYAAKPMMSNESVHSQSYPRSSVGFEAMVHTGLSQLGSNMTSKNQNFVAPSGMEKENIFLAKTPVVPDAGLLGQGLVEKDVVGTDIEMSKEVLSNKSGPQKTFSKDGIIENASEKVAGPVSSETRADVKGCDEDTRTGASSHLLQQNHEIQVETEVMGPSSNDFDKIPKLSVSRPEAPVRENQLPLAGPPAGILPLSGQSFPILASTTNTGRGPGYYGHPPIARQGQLLSTQYDPLGIMGKTPQQSFDGQSDLKSEAAILKDQKDGSSFQSGERLPIRSEYDNDTSILRTNGETDLDSKFGVRDSFNQSPVLPTRPFDQASRPLDEAPLRSSYDAGVKSNPGAMDPPSRFIPPHHPFVMHGRTDALGPSPEFGRQIKHFPSLNPDTDYFGISPRGFGVSSNFPRGTSALDDINSRDAQRYGEAARSFNLPVDPVGNSFNDRRFSHIPSHLRGGISDGSKSLGFGEHMTRGSLHNHIRGDNAIGQDGLGGPLTRGEFSGPGFLSGHFLSDAVGPLTFPGPENFHHRPFGESIRSDRPSIPYFGDPSLRSSYPMPGFPNSGSFVGEIDPFDPSRKRKLINMGWCRICQFDCDTVEGLEMHSQTREHQKMSMDMVKTIKQNNKKKQRPAGHAAHEGVNRNKKVGINGRGNKP